MPPPTLHPDRAMPVDEPFPDPADPDLLRRVAWAAWVGSLTGLTVLAVELLLAGTWPAILHVDARSSRPLEPVAVALITLVIMTLWQGPSEGHWRTALLTSGLALCAGTVTWSLSVVISVVLLMDDPDGGQLVAGALALALLLHAVAALTIRRLTRAA